MSKDPRLTILALLVSDFMKNVNVPPQPWLVMGEPSVEDLEAAFSAFPQFEELVSEGVLVSTRVFDAGSDPSGVLGFVKGIQIEGIGSTPEEAVANTLSGVEFGTLEEMQRRADAVFSSYYEALGVGVRVPDKERGIFLKTNNAGQVVVLDEYRNVNMKAVRERAFKWRQDMIDLQKAVTVGYLEEVARRQKLVEQALTQYTTALRRAGRLEAATRAVEASRKAASELRAAAKAREEAQKYSKLLGGLSVLQGIIGAASTVNNYTEKVAQTKAMDALKADISSVAGKIGYIETEIQSLSNALSDMHRNLKQEIDSIAPSNVLVILKESIHIDFSGTQQKPLD